jgi:hypothetical protein
VSTIVSERAVGRRNTNGRKLHSGRLWTCKNIGIGWKCQAVTNTLAYYTKKGISKQ